MFAKNKGFSIVELLVTLFIISFLSGAFFLIFGGVSKKENSLMRSAEKLVSDIRKAQSMALASVNFSGQAPRGYGVYFDKNNNKKYILFADLAPGDNRYQPSEKSEEISFTEGAIIYNLKAGTVEPQVLNVTFYPPEPQVFFYDASSEIVSDNMEIILSIEGDSSLTKSVVVGNRGAVEIK